MNPSLEDEKNRLLLSIAEDQLTGFHRHPFTQLAERTGLAEEEVIARLHAMLEAGLLRRIRQTLLSTSLAEGALVAWRIEDSKLEAAYAWLRDNDPFTGHVVRRSCDNPEGPGANYRLWTTLKVPHGQGSMQKHAEIIMKHTGADDVIFLPVVGMFSLAVGHVRRAGLRVGERKPEPPIMQRPAQPQLSAREWDVLLSLKESLSLDELRHEPWEARAAALGMSLDEYCNCAQQLDEKKVIGRFASFLDHQGKRSKHSGTGASGLFHWTVPEGMEERAGALCGQHVCMTHCYWRSGGEVFGGAQIMGVVHAPTREEVLAHKAAIDQYLQQHDVPLLHTAVFWSEKAEIRPSELCPKIYQQWLARFASHS